MRQIDHVAAPLQVVGCGCIVRCYANEEPSLADLDAEGHPHPTKTALSKLKKVCCIMWRQTLLSTSAALPASACRVPAGKFHLHSVQDCCVAGWSAFATQAHVQF